MSAPAGWHLQPDGRERYWDGTAWTNQFRAPLPSDPTAPPPPPGWAASADETQALDVEHTQAIPGPQAQPVQPVQPGYPPTSDQAQPGYGYPAAGAGAAPGAYPQAGYPQAGYPQTGYGTPTGGPYAPPPRQGNGLAKGCLIAAIIGLLVLGGVVVGGIYVFNRAADTISDTFPSGLPTNLPSDFPSDLPTEGLGQSIDITVGGGFELPRATVESGWTLEPQGGVAMVQITGMKARRTSNDDFPVLFTMSFPEAGGGTVETVCTAPGGASGATVDVSCVPLFGDVADATRATVTASL
jgi:hypothetical protein